MNTDRELLEALLSGATIVNQYGIEFSLVDDTLMNISHNYKAHIEVPSKHFNQFDIKPEPVYEFKWAYSSLNNSVYLSDDYLTEEEVDKFISDNLVFNVLKVPETKRIRKEEN